MIIVIPAFFPNFSNNSSQYQVLKRRLTWLSEIDEVRVIAPKHKSLEFRNLIRDFRPIYFDFDGGRYPNVLADGYLNILEKLDFNKILVIDMQSLTAFDLWKGLHSPPYKFPKVMLDYVENTEDFPNTDPRMIAMLQSYVFMPTIVNSAATMRQLGEKAVRYFQPAAIAKNEQRHVANLGLMMDELATVRAENVQKYEKFTFIYSGSHLMGFKNIDAQLKVFDYLFKAGLDFDFRMYVYPGSDRKKADKLAEGRPYMKVGDALGQQGYWREARKCHAFIHTSKNETYGFAVWELIELGVLGLFLDRQWIRDISYPGEEFVGKGTKEISAIARSLFLTDEQEPQYKNLLEKQQEWWQEARKEHTQEYAKQSYLNAVKSIKEHYKI